MYPQEKIIRGLLTLLTILDAKFNLQDEEKVPKDLLKIEVTAKADAETLFAAFTQSKARRMREAIF